MRNLFTVISLSAVLASCATQSKKPAAKKPVPAKSSPTAAKPAVQTKTVTALPAGVEFYTKNIGDITKNDNTMSHGSIVSAKPAGYKVVKTYFPAVAQNFRQKYIILHYTALDDEKSKSVLTQQAVSSHYLVNNTGNNEIYQLVDENKRAYHAGVSTWRNDSNLNDTSIGIEIVNAGYTRDSAGNKTFYAFDDAQVRKVAALVKDIVNRYQIPATNVLAHSDVAPTRKQDPGPLFPWKKLYDQYQVGMWYDEMTKQNFLAQMTPESFTAEQNTSPFIFKVQTALQQFGYGINPTGTWDKNNKMVVEAFQYHFRPQNYDGNVDMETWAILQALLQKYPAK